VNNILITVFFFKCSHFNFKTDPDKVLFEEQEFEMSQNKGVKASKIVEKISQQQSLTKWKNPEVKPSLWYWLDPIQSEIMYDPNPYQIIVGPASTGKTLLIHLKVFQILQKEEKEAVLIILPLENLKHKYIQLFKDCGLKEEVDNLFIMTVREDWKTVMQKHKPNVFIDEFSAVQSIDESVLNKVLILAKTNVQINRLIWLTIDVLQSFNTYTLGLPQIQDKTYIETASRRHLLLVHRCTKRVFQVDLDFLHFFSVSKIHT
jgi:hypothetical protein